MESLSFTMDGKPIEAGKGTTLLQAAQVNGIEIPTYCSDENLRPYGACRLCVVEISPGGGKRLVSIGISISPLAGIRTTTFI